MEHPDSPEMILPESPTQQDKSNSIGIYPEYCNPNYIMPNVIDVRVNIGDENYIFPVTIVKASQKKSYLGGYRNKINGFVYHHASSQTPSETQKKAKDYSNLRSREAQTIEQRTLSIQLNRESGTQMERIDLKVDNKNDRVKFAKPYFTSDELLLRKKIAAVVMQRYWRGFMARRRANEIRFRNIEYKVKQQQSKEEAENIEKEKRIEDMSRRVNPRSNGDFAVLYNELDAWRKTEVSKIKASISDPEERKTAMAELLLNETKALQHLQSLKYQASKEMQDEKTQSMLTNMAQPLRWQLHNNETALVHTPETQRAKYLLDLFQKLQELSNNAEINSIQSNEVQRKNTFIDERLKLLVTIKWEVNEYRHYFTPSQETIELIDREADLLSRNRPLKSMSNLRTRLINLFLQFIQNPDCNPRAGDFIVEKVA